MRFLLIFALFFCSSLSLSAQKMGHLNVGNLIEDMPEAKYADTILVMLRNTLITDGQARAKAFEANYTKFMADYQGGGLTPQVAQQQQAVLEQEYAQIEALSSAMEDSISQRRSELLTPLLKSIDTAVQAVGKEAGYVFIFDASVQNAILFANDSDDVEALVRKKMGLPVKQ